MRVNKQTLTVLLLGQTGAGKSEFGNAYLRNKSAFVASNDADSCTQNTICRENEVDGIIRCAIDTPGFGDSDGKDPEHIQKMVDFLKNYNKGVVAIALVIQVFQYRVDQHLKNVIKELNILFNNPEIWNHFCLVFSHCQPNFNADRVVKEQNFRQSAQRVFTDCVGPSIPLPSLTIFSIGSVLSETDEQTQHETQQLHNFAASMERPIATNDLKTPEEIFMKIEKKSETIKVLEESCKIPFEVDITYEKQIPYTVDTSDQELEPYHEQEYHTEYVQYQDDVEDEIQVPFEVDVAYEEQEPNAFPFQNYNPLP
jgi:GTPase SAR1 family protein